MSSAWSFDEVYRRHEGIVRANLLRFGVSSCALDDATQEVFVVVHRRVGTYEPARSSMTTWIFGITRRVAADWRRTRARERRRRDACRRLQPRPPCTGLVEARLLFEELLSSIGDAEAQIFVESRVLGVPLERVAENLGLNRNTAASRLRVTRKRLAARLLR